MKNKTTAFSNILMLAISSISMAGCSISKQVFSLKENNATQQRSNIFTLKDPQSEIKCFADLAATYHEWNDGAGSPEINKKYNIAILPITNQTSGKSEQGREHTLPSDLGLVAQNIASQLGIKYNVIFMPSIKDLPTGNNTFNDFFIERAPRATNSETNVDTNHITIIAAITEYDIVKNSAPANNIDSRGSINGKSLSLSFGHSKESYSGRITMIFNTAYFSEVNGYATKKLVYNPNTFTKLSINFEDTVNQNKIGFSFNGGQPTLGFSYGNTHKDSRYAALDLLVERGLIQVLGKYHAIPYWRCASENLINQNNLTPKKLSDVRNMPGYDADIEAQLRRWYLYTGNNLRLGRYKLRIPKINVDEQILFITEKANTEEPAYKQDAPIYPLIVKRDKWIDFNKKYNQCPTIDTAKKLEIEREHLLNLKNINTDTHKVNSNRQKVDELSHKIETSRQCVRNRFIDDFQTTFSKDLNEQEFTKDTGKSYIFFDVSNYSGESFLRDLNQTIIHRYLDHPNLVGDRLNYKEFVKEINQDSEIPNIDKFITLWLSAPYLKDARIYPFYIHKSPSNIYESYKDNVYGPVKEYY